MWEWIVLVDCCCVGSGGNFVLQYDVCMCVGILVEWGEGGAQEGEDVEREKGVQAD